MKKDIYIIRNNINDKVYIGQSINVAERFKSHCKVNNSYNSIIDRAIQKYGKSNFYYQILESQVENYNEKERFWIKEFNSIVPNGYNIAIGGEDPPIYYGIECPNASIKDAQILLLIKNDLQNTTKSLLEIAQDYGTNKKTILRINQGISYVDKKDTYPIRKIPNINGKLTEADVDDIIDILMFSYRQYADIGNQYGVSIHTIQNINNGVNHIRENINYPIRKYKNSGTPIFTYEDVTEIIDLFKSGIYSIRQLSSMYNVTIPSIQGVVNGTSLRYKRDSEIYPIRKL